MAMQMLYFNANVIKIVATRCNVLRLKCTTFSFGWGSAPNPAGGAYSAPSDSLAGLKGPTSKGEERKEGRVGEGEERGREGRGGKMGEGRMKVGGYGAMGAEDARGHLDTSIVAVLLRCRQQTFLIPRSVCLSVSLLSISISLISCYTHLLIITRYVHRTRFYLWGFTAYEPVYV